MKLKPPEFPASVLRLKIEGQSKAKCAFQSLDGTSRVFFSKCDQEDFQQVGEISFCIILADNFSKSIL